MSYFRDLTPYSYGYFPEELHSRVLNIGWLEVTQPFVTGRLPEAWIDRLWQFCTISVPQMRGYHVCDLCASHNDVAVHAEHKNERLMLGSAEIRVFAKDGVVFAAPNLVYHYVVTHGYRPPDVFVEAVVTSSAPPDQAYFDLLTAYGAERSDTISWTPEEIAAGASFIRGEERIRRDIVPFVYPITNEPTD